MEYRLGSFHLQFEKSRERVAEAENYNTDNDLDPQDEADSAPQEYQKILD